MSSTAIAFSVFTKPWKMSIPELGELVRGLGSTQIDLPVRPGYQVEPARVGADPPAATRVLAEAGLEVATIAASLDEPTIAGAPTPPVFP